MIKFKKSNGKDLDRVDLILNSMWSKLVTTWNYIKIANEEWFNKHIGYKISMFYFPVTKPILVEYKNNIEYLIDRVFYQDEEIRDIDALFSNVKDIDKFHVKIKHPLKKIPVNEVLDLYENCSYNIKTTFLNMFDNSKLWAKDQPEGYIFKWKKNLYQHCFIKHESLETEKTSYEFLLITFMNYCKSINYIDKINQSYTKTICTLFNDFILNYERKTNAVEHNINIEAIKNPYLGTYNDIGYEYIPDTVTVNLCKESELNKNIFKVLLANLRKGKDYSRCILMSTKQVDEWNNIVKNIKIRTLHV